MLPSLLLMVLAVSQAEPASPTNNQAQLPIVTDDYHPNEPAMVALVIERLPRVVVERARPGGRP